MGTEAEVGGPEVGGPAVDWPALPAPLVTPSYGSSSLDSLVPALLGPRGSDRRGSRASSATPPRSYC